MQVVQETKKNAISKRKKEEKIKGLFFKKRILEDQLKVSNIGATITTKYLEAIEAKLKDLPEGSFERAKLEYDKIKMQREAADYISDWKEFRRNYEEGLIVELQQTLEREEFNEVGFHYLEEQANQLAEHELFGKVVVKPTNIELAEVNKEIEQYIEILKTLNTEIQAKLENDKSLDALEKIRLEKELFDNSLHLQTQEKRLRKRMDYYINQFLPQYEEDMKECEQNLELYMSIAKQISEASIDLTIKAMLDEHDKHKDDPEQLWLFYTALRARLKAIKTAVDRNKKKMPKAAEILKALN